MSSEADGTRTLLLLWRLLLWRTESVVSHRTSMMSFMVPVGDGSKRDQVISISGGGAKSEKESKENLGASAVGGAEPLRAEMALCTSSRATWPFRIASTSRGHVAHRLC